MTPFYIDRSELDLLKLTGATRLDLIHRMSTQDLRGIQHGEGRATVLTTDIGRIIDRLILHVDGEAAFAITSAGNGDGIARYLLRFVFFTDDFQIAPAEAAIFGVYGDGAGNMLGTSDLPLHHWREVADGIKVQRTDAVGGEGFFVMGDKPAVQSHLESLGIGEGSAETFNYLRVQSGVPLFRHELTSDYIPLETGLWDDISFSKGCYIGQEIIARMESRGKLAKKLVQFSADSPLTAPTDITSNGKSVGTLTSAASLNGNTVALGYVKSRALESELSVDGVALTLIT